MLHPRFPNLYQLDVTWSQQRKLQQRLADMTDIYWHHFVVTITREICTKERWSCWGSRSRCSYTRSCSGGKCWREHRERSKSGLRDVCLAKFRWQSCFRLVRMSLHKGNFLRNLKRMDNFLKKSDLMFRWREWDVQCQEGYCSGAFLPSFVAAPLSRQQHVHCCKL